MKKNTPLEEMSDEALIKLEKAFRGISIITIFSFVVMVVVAIFITGKKGFSIFTVMPIVFLPIYLNAVSTWKKNRAELKKRNLL